MDTNTENKREVSHEVKRLGGASKTASQAFVNIFIIIMNQEGEGLTPPPPWKSLPLDVRSDFRLVSFLFIFLPRKKYAARTQNSLRAQNGFRPRCLGLLVCSDPSLMNPLLVILRSLNRAHLCSLGEIW